MRTNSFLIPCLASATTLFAAPVEILPADLRGAVQPQVAVAASGRIHVVFGKGSALYHTASPDGLTFSTPVKVGELDNRGSHFYLALYWAEALAAQLWSHDEESFLPHGSKADGFPDLQPIWLHMDGRTLTQHFGEELGGRHATGHAEDAIVIPCLMLK